MSLKMGLVHGALVVSLATTAVGQTHSMMGGEAPPFNLQSLEGEAVSLEALRGQLVVLPFGAGW